jgi:HEPN domain-containing protein
MTTVQLMIDDLRQMCQIESSVFDKYLKMEHEQIKNAYFSGWFRANAMNYEEKYAEQFLNNLKEEAHGK